VIDRNDIKIALCLNHLLRQQTLGAKIRFSQPLQNSRRQRALAPVKW